ncbi:hypothetical protein Mapa_010618 [Marchantia paleacea]|nr:hypothetical protein Mapa_010618 [Marchantia paleacea]
MEYFSEQLEQTRLDFGDLLEYNSLPQLPSYDDAQSQPSKRQQNWARLSNRAHWAENHGRRHRQNAREKVVAWTVGPVQAKRIHHLLRANSGWL